MSRKKRTTISRTISLAAVQSAFKRNSKTINRGLSAPTASIPCEQSGGSGLTSSLSPVKSDIQVIDPGQWLLWCEENKVIGSENNISLEHYDLECFRRYFNSLKARGDDSGVHPQHLADSMLRAEIFVTLSDSLHFVRMLKAETNDGLLVTFNDLLNAAHCRSTYRRNKVRSFIKYVSSSETFHSRNSSAQDGGHNDDSVTKPHPQSCSSVVNTPGISDKHPFKNIISTSLTMESLPDDSDQQIGTFDQELQQGCDVSKKPLSGAISQLISNASGLIGSIFEKSHTEEPAPVILQEQRSESATSFRSLKNYFSQSSYRSSANVYVETSSRRIANSPHAGGLLTPPSMSYPKSPFELMEMDNSEAPIPSVRMKRAAMKIYVANQVTHLFKSKNCRVAAGFEDF